MLSWKKAYLIEVKLQYYGRSRKHNVVTITVNYQPGNSVYSSGDILETISKVLS